MKKYKVIYNELEHDTKRKKTYGVVVSAQNKEEAEILAINDLLDTLKDNSYECDYKIVENYEDNVFYTVSRTGIVKNTYFGFKVA